MIRKIRHTTIKEKVINRTKLVNDNKIPNSKSLITN